MGDVINFDFRKIKDEPDDSLEAVLAGQLLEELRNFTGLDRPDIAASVANNCMVNLREVREHLPFQFDVSFLPANMMEHNIAKFLSEQYSEQLTGHLNRIQEAVTRTVLQMGHNAMMSTAALLK